MGNRLLFGREIVSLVERPFFESLLYRLKPLSKNFAQTSKLRPIPKTFSLQTSKVLYTNTLKCYTFKSRSFRPGIRKAEIQTERITRGIGMSMESLWTPLFSFMVFALVFGLFGDAIAYKTKAVVSAVIVGCLETNFQSV